MRDAQGPEPTAVPLAMLERGRRARVLVVSGVTGFAQRLASFAILPGAEIQVLSDAPVGPLMLSVREAGRVALGRGMAGRILVEPL